MKVKWRACQVIISVSHFNFCKRVNTHTCIPPKNRAKHDPAPGQLSSNIKLNTYAYIQPYREWSGSIHSALEALITLYLFIYSGCTSLLPNLCSFGILAMFYYKYWESWLILAFHIFVNFQEPNKGFKVHYVMDHYLNTITSAELNTRKFKIKMVRLWTNRKSWRRVEWHDLVSYLFMMISNMI